MISYIDSDINAMKPVSFLGDSLDRLRGFPDGARREAGFQIERLQRGLEPDDWKPLKTIGAGVREIRVRDQARTFRVVYLASLTDAVYVRHAFQKKTRTTPQRDLDTAIARYKALVNRNVR